MYRREEEFSDMYRRGSMNPASKGGLKRHR